MLRRAASSLAMLGALAVAGCASSNGKPFIAWGHSNPPATQPTVAATETPDAANADVVAHKPFVAKPKPFVELTGPQARPTILLQVHARSDSPVPLSEYGKQPTHNVADFHLRADLSEAEVWRRLGPPAQLADYSTPWVVYRLGTGYELWLQFAQPNADSLVAADVVGPVEDGYTRNRVFSIQDAPQ